MPDIPISIASGEYDRIRAIRDGIVKVEGCAVTYHVVEPNQLFVRNLKDQEFDVSEMSFSTYIALRDQGKAHYTAIPVFLSRAFRHSAIFVRTDRGIASPADLKGKQIGTPEYFTTMLVWMRGLLSDEYHVAPSDLQWKLGGLEQPAKPGATDNVAAVSIEHVADGKTLSAMLADGEIDAIFSARPPSCFTKGAANVGRLFADTRAVEQAYYKKTGIYPLMHAVGIRNRLVEQNPWLAGTLFKAYVQSKEIALADLQKLAAFSVTLPWIDAEYRATQAVLGPDIWPYGIEANGRSIDTLCRYLAEQGLDRKRMQVDELFAKL